MPWTVGDLRAAIDELPVALPLFVQIDLSSDSSPGTVVRPDTEIAFVVGAGFYEVDSDGPEYDGAVARAFLIDCRLARSMPLTPALVASLRLIDVDDPRCTSLHGDPS
jgi:hypothetical protein